MGIGCEFIELLTRLRTAGFVPHGGSVAELGAQQLANSFLEASAALRELGDGFGVSQPLQLPAKQASRIAHGELEHLPSDAPAARCFWEWLGFRYTAIDIDGSPQTLLLDLNYDSVPDEKLSKYIIVTNFGTTEHVANQLNAFKVIHDLTACNGLMIHEVPAQGMFNHGLINYNFKFFWMLSRSNDYNFIYASYRQDKLYSLPSNIIDFIASTNPDKPVGRIEWAADSLMTIVMQKKLDRSFVPPIDVPTGTKTDLDILKSRYWTVFDADA